MHLLEIASRWAWETSIATCVLIVPALFAAVALRKAAFTNLRYVLGLLVVVRLLMPMAIPSPLSVFNLFSPSVERALTLPTISQATPAPILLAQPTERTGANKFMAPHRSLSILPIVWACGAIAILARVFWQHCRVRRWIAAGAEITDGTAVDALKSALKVAKRQRQIRVYAVAELKTPALFGVFRPTILLPREFVASGNLARLRLVFLHEIAHLRRMDVLVNWLGIFARALHWFNPLVWLALRRLRVDQELLCDRDVMRTLHPEEHHGYGETLLALASPRAFELSTLIPVSSNFKQLKERIAMIKQFKPVTNRLLLFALPPLAAVLAIVTFTAAADKKPAKAPEVIDLAENPKTNIERRKYGLAVLQNELDRQTEKVQKTEIEVDELRKKLALPPVTTENELYASESEVINRVENDTVHANQEYVQREELLKNLKSKSREQLLHVIPTAYADAALDSLLQNLNKSQQQLAVLQKDYSDEHQEVQRITALIKTLNQQINSRLDGIMAGLESLVAAHRAVVKDLEQQLVDRKAKESERFEQARPYFRALHNLEMERKLREAIQLRLVQEKVDLMVAH
jgi:beta-lactamase regulating signal transducer with metallopeptidase domain